MDQDLDPNPDQDQDQDLDPDQEHGAQECQEVIFLFRSEKQKQSDSFNINPTEKWKLLSQGVFWSVCVGMMQWDYHSVGLIILTPASSGWRRDQQISAVTPELMMLCSVMLEFLIGRVLLFLRDLGSWQLWRLSAIVFSNLQQKMETQQEFILKAVWFVLLNVCPGVVRFLKIIIRLMFGACEAAAAAREQELIWKMIPQNRVRAVRRF
ncbi:uncharacterized protein LOC114143686 [Xiphophorus couchianus]|uniref:uncharacterized protein LOC114143686 n=1 Tax=Xiphophorus couchianus TaxID=32473 RepID=UPI0010167C2E|nr:uncharacterized protein LOC114143686 [Xiphophorus couchianus]